MQRYKYKAFLSYSHANSDWSKWLLRALESYRLPRQAHPRPGANLIRPRLGAIFRDRDELPASGHMTDRIFEAIGQSEYMIVVCSPEAAKSKLVNREIAEFKRCRSENYLLCVIVDGIPFADNPADECFPEALRHKFAADGRAVGFAPEGLAADARAEGDGKQMAILKLVAGMMGVGLNDLVRREAQRRQQRWIGAAVAASTGMALLGGLAFEASRARSELEVALALAEERGIQAEKRLTDVEKLTYFFMTTAYDELLTAGSLITLEHVSERMAQYLANTPENEIRLGQTLQLIGAELRLGQALERGGKTKRAGEIFAATRERAKQIFESLPDDGTARVRYATTLFFTGYLHMRLGEYASAARDFTERLRIVQQGYSQHQTIIINGKVTDPEAWQEEIADSEALLCLLQLAPLGRPDLALENCTSSIARRTQITLNDPSSAANISLAGSHQYLGETYLAVGRLGDARSAFLNRLANYETVLATAPQNYRVLRRQAMAWQNLAGVDSLEGKTDAALTRLSEAVKTFDRLTTQDPVNVMWRGDSAEAHRQYGAALLAAGRLDQAYQHWQIADQQITATLEADNSRVARRLFGHKTRLLAANIAQARGQDAEAKKLLAAAILAFEAEPDTYAQVPGALDFASQLYLNLADAHTKAGDDKAASAALAKLVALDSTAIATKTPIFTKNVAHALSLLGETDTADNLAEIVMPEPSKQ